MATNEAATANPSRFACDCGGDHERRKSRVCPVFEMMSALNKSVEDFLDMQQVLEFGKDGPMASSLRIELEFKYSETGEQFNKYEKLSNKHPEWNVAEKISKLRRYFYQVSNRSMDDEGLPGVHLPAPTMPDTGACGSADGSPLLRAKVNTYLCYRLCCEVVREYMRNGAVPLGRTGDHQGYLPKVDAAFKQAFNVIIRLESHENATIQRLMQQSLDCWKESRRLLCDFRRTPRGVVE
jgi:hypothetical protein